MQEQRYIEHTYTIAIYCTLSLPRRCHLNKNAVQTAAAKLEDAAAIACTRYSNKHKTLFLSLLYRRMAQLHVAYKRSPPPPFTLSFKCG